MVRSAKAAAVVIRQILPCGLAISAAWRTVSGARRGGSREQGREDKLMQILVEKNISTHSLVADTTLICRWRENCAFMCHALEMEAFKCRILLFRRP